MFMEQERQYSLTEVANLVGGVLSECLPESLWVRAEIGSLSERGGHAYMDLVEKSSRGGLLSAKMRGVCWSDTWGMLQAWFQQETDTALRAGMQVLLEVEVSHHAVYGLSLVVVGIDPRYTAGDIAQQRQQTIARLRAEGVLDMNKSLTLPTLTRRLAIVSSDRAAGYEDFCDQLAAGGFPFRTALYSATMQGDNAEQSIIHALSAIAERAEEYDAVVIIRGGGATSDLSCFDQYNLCNHCAQFPLPVLTGIGHTRDVSVLDTVAHTALKTPTAVAAFLNDRMAAEAERIRQLRQRLGRTAEHQILVRRHRIELLRQRLEACSPARIYALGYSLLTVEGRVVRSVADVRRGQHVTTHLADGEVRSVVE